MRAFDDVRKALRQAGIRRGTVLLEPYYVQLGSGRAAPPLLSPRMSPRLPIARTGRRTSRAIRRTCRGPIWAAPPSAISPLRSPIRAIWSSPRAETPRPGERRDVVWDKYVKGEPTISKRDPSEHANASDVARSERPVISDAAYSLGSTPESEFGSIMAPSRMPRRSARGQFRASTFRPFARTRTPPSVIQKAARGPAARQGACHGADGRRAGGGRLLPQCLHAQSDHYRVPARPGADARRSRPPCRGLRSWHQSHRHRPHQRRAALPRARAPGRQRICRGAGQGRCRSSRASPPSTPTPRPVRSDRSSPLSAPRAARARAPFATTPPSPSPRRSRATWSSPISICRSARPGSTSTRTRSRASPMRLPRPSAWTRCCSTGCSRAAPII